MSDNALGIFMEPAPFPSALLELDLHRAGYRTPALRAEADFLLKQAGNAGPHGNNAGLYSLSRSPSSMPSTFSQTPSPSTASDDSLPKLSLGHRHDLEIRNLDLARSLSASSLHGSGRRPSSSPADRQTFLKRTDSDSLYKMPVLRSMSPLEDMSSNSDEEEVGSISVGGSSLFATLPPPLEGPLKPESQDVQKESLEEGTTGEIFANHKTLLPLTLQQGDDKKAKQ